MEDYTIQVGLIITAKNEENAETTIEDLMSEVVEFCNKKLKNQEEEITDYETY